LRSRSVCSSRNGSFACGSAEMIICFRCFGGEAAKTPEKAEALVQFV
jgi:hypothetical protein